MKQIFELSEPFGDDSHPVVAVGDEQHPVLDEASRAAGKYVIEAEAELGQLHGWKRRDDLEQLRDAAAVLKAKLDAMTDEERDAYEKAEADERDAEAAAKAKAEKKAARGAGK